MNFIENAIDRLLVDSDGGINSRLEQIAFEIDISNTKAKGYCYCLKLDGNGNPRWKDLVEYVTDKIVDYSIPKRDIDDARIYFQKTNSTSKIINLKRRAAQLFTHLKTTGEGGEMLLYILAQEFLKIPQLISKMSLKTSGDMHYHGVDGIHVKYDPLTDSLILYWGESKMYADINGGIKSCFESLKGFLLDTYGYKSTQERDLQLLTSQIGQNVNDEKLEDLLVRYFDKDDDLSNNVQYKGICFIGFDCKHYPNTPLTKTLDVVKKEIEKELETWLQSAGTFINSHRNLQLYEIHVFLIPFISVQEFRDYFIETINS